MASPLTPDPVVINPPASLLTVCSDPLLVSNEDADAITQNKRAYQLAWKNCRDKVQSIIDWYAKRAVPVKK